MSEIPHRYFILNKPFNMVSQFISTDDVRLLGDIDFDFPEGTHAIGRIVSIIYLTLPNSGKFLLIVCFV